MYFFTGFLVGIVSLIPGISGGTILVLMKKYEELAEIITNFKKKENKILLTSLVLGILLGAITFAKIIELLFYFFPKGTMILFSGFVLFHLPKLFKENHFSFRFIPFFLGIFLIFLLSSFHIHSDVVITEYPKFTFGFLLSFGFFGMVDGFFTIIPGISGSMILMILGPYFLYKSFLANLSFKNIHFILPLFFYLIGDFAGFFLGSKFSLYFLNHFYSVFMNIILGMVLASAIILLPIPTLSITSIVSYFVLLFISYFIVQLLER